MSKGLHVKKQGMTPRNRERLRQFDLPHNVDALIGLPLRIFEELGRTKTPTPEQALRAMHAVAVELLLHVPVRIGNLTQTEIGKNLLEVRRGKERRYHLVFSTSETKNSEPVEAEISLQSAELLEHYMKHFRQVLGEPGSNRLFTGARREDGVRASGAFSTSLTEFILKETGLNMHMHLFRHLAGYFYLARNPDDIETVRRLLGHRSTATTLRSYASLRTDLAFRRYDALIAERRSSDALSTQVKARTGEEFGEPINLHSFRHIAATTIATVDPANAAFIAAILDHTSFRASDKHYNRARTIDAARRYGAVLAEARTGRSGGGTPLAHR